MSDQQESGPFKLSCPLCTGTFTGRLPARPARGGCPVCKKDLVLLPDGKIQTGKDFDSGAGTDSDTAPEGNLASPGEPVQTGTGKSLFATLLFLMPAVILILLTSVKLPEKTHDVFHRLGEKAGKGLLHMQMEIQNRVKPEKEETRNPTRQRRRGS